MGYPDRNQGTQNQTAEAEENIFDLLLREHRLLAEAAGALHGAEPGERRSFELSRFESAFSNHLRLEELSLGVPAYFLSTEVRRDIQQDHENILGVIRDLHHLDHRHTHPDLWNNKVEELQDVMVTHLFQMEEEVFLLLREVMTEKDTASLRKRLTGVCDCFPKTRE